jgi:CheY-like chemotaxis protein
LARHIAEQLGGSVEVSSSLDRGSTFTLRVATGPLDDAHWIPPDEVAMPARLTAFDQSALALGPFVGEVLLADDFPDTRNLIREVLESRGATVTAVDNGEAAVEEASKRTFDLILMDVRMPRMDGATATRELRNRNYLAPIIALTASTMEGDRQRILDAGFDDLWIKPLTLERLVSESAAYLRPSRKGDSEDPAESDPWTRLTNPRLEAVRTEFVRKLPQRLAKVREAVEERDMDQAREKLHQLVGAGGTYGLMPISHEAARLLSLAKSGKLADRPEELQALTDLVNAAVASLVDGDGAGPTSPE